MKRALTLSCLLATTFIASHAPAAEKPETVVRVACIGDLITFGLGIKDRTMTYPAQLQQLLGDGYEVRNFGNSGRSILKKSMRGKEKRGFIFMKEHTDALAFKPDIVISNLGINDLMDFDKFGDDFVADYVELLGAYRELDSKPRLIVWTPLAPLFKGHNFHGDPTIDRINRSIEQVVKELKIESIDLARPFADRADLFPDKIHPNADGAAVIARELAGFLGHRSISASDGVPVFEIRDLPAGVAKEGHGKDATQYGYRIPSMLTTAKGTVIAFVERRLGLHDHAQNDIVLRRSTDGGKTWGPEIVAYEDGMNSINDPLTVQLDSGRILMMFARFPYGRHARTSGWIKMADLGYGNRNSNVLTFTTFSDDDGLTWSEPIDISRMVKPEHWVNANSPGAMIQLQRGPDKGRIVTPLWGTLPPETEGGARRWEIAVVHSDDGGVTWSRSQPLEDPEKGFPNECQIAEASNSDLVIISRNQGGAAWRKKSISTDGGTTWPALATDKTLPSVACMGSIVRGPEKADGSWDLYASFPSNSGRKNGQLAISRDHGETFEIQTIVKGGFGYSTTQISPNGKHLLCLYETGRPLMLRLLSIPLRDLQ